MKILVTGGAGFIGSNLVEKLLELEALVEKIMILDSLTYAANIQFINNLVSKNEKVEFWYGDVRNNSLVEKLVSQADIIFHLAAETHVTRSIFDNRTFFDTDVIGTQTIANAALNHRKQVKLLVHVSTSEVYGTSLTEFMTEDHPLRPMSPYASAKCGADRLIYSYVQTYDLPFVIVRPFNNYGPRQHLEKLIPRFITSILSGEKMNVHGNGSATRDFIHVFDTCRFLIKLLEIDYSKLKGEVFNLASGKPVSVLEIAKMLINMNIDSKAIITFNDDRPGQVLRHCGSFEKAFSLGGWKPSIEFKEGLAQTLNWYQDNSDSWKDQLWAKTIQIKLPDGRKINH